MRVRLVQSPDPRGRLHIVLDDTTAYTTLCGVCAYPPDWRWWGMTETEALAPENPLCRRCEQALATRQRREGSR